MIFKIGPSWLPRAILWPQFKNQNYKIYPIDVAGDDSRFSDEELNAGRPKHFFKKRKQTYTAVSSAYKGFVPVQATCDQNQVPIL